MATFAIDSDDNTVGTEVDTEMLVSDLPDAKDEGLESDVIISPPSILAEDQKQASTTATTTAQAIPDGIYALKNGKNRELFMDTQYGASAPGYSNMHIVNPRSKPWQMAVMQTAVYLRYLTVQTLVLTSFVL